MVLFDSSSTLYFENLGTGVGWGSNINFELKEPTINTRHMNLKGEMTTLIE